MLPISILIAVFAPLGAAWDLRHRRIPNVLVVLAAGAGLLYRAIPGGPGLMDGVVALGWALLIGFALFAIGALGGGDAKFFAALAALLGKPLLLPFALTAGFAGGLLAITDVVFRRRLGLAAAHQTKELAVYLVTLGRGGSRRDLDDAAAIRVPYGVAIAAGAVFTWFVPLELWWPQ